MAFNVNKVSATWSRFAKWIGQNTAHATSSMRFAENMVDGEKKLEAIDSYADTSAGIPSKTEAAVSTKTTDKKPQNLSLLIIGYLFVILPVQEFQFAFELLGGRGQYTFLAATHVAKKLRPNVRYMVYAITNIIRLCAHPFGWLRCASISPFLS